jgi:chromosome segregation ATPase
MVNPESRLDAAMERRRLELNLEWRDIAGRGGLAYETLRALRRTGRASSLSKRRAEAGLGWTAGSIDAVLAGGEPVTVETAELKTTEPTVDGLRQLITETEDELRWLSPKYESNRASLTAHLERRLDELRRQLESLQNKG